MSHAFLRINRLLSLYGPQPLLTMFVRISPANRAPLDFEVEGDCNYLTEEIQEAVKDIIHKETGCVLLHNLFNGLS